MVAWDEIHYRAGVAADETTGRAAVFEQARVPGASLQNFADWFIETFSMQDVVKAAKKRLQSTFGQTEILDTHYHRCTRSAVWAAHSKLNIPDNLLQGDARPEGLHGVH